MIKIYFSNKVEKIAEISKPKTGCLVYVENPAEPELIKLSEDHGLDIDLLKDGLDPNEAPRIDTWENRTYIFTRFVLPESEKQTTSPVLIIFGLDMLYIVTREPFEALKTVFKNDGIATSKRAQMVLRILYQINLGYKARINSVAKRMWSVRSQLN